MIDTTWLDQLTLVIEPLTAGRQRVVLRHKVLGVDAFQKVIDSPDELQTLLPKLKQAQSDYWDRLKNSSPDWMEGVRLRKFEMVFHSNTDGDGVPYFDCRVIYKHDHGMIVTDATSYDGYDHAAHRAVDNFFKQLEKKLRRDTLIDATEKDNQ